ncbi:XkdX family protein [Christensenella intestinihominis]|nr:XkdX family protein [Christensenella intestinihominis]
MFETLKRLYQGGRLDKAGLQGAVDMGWITGEQMNEIMGENDAD